MKKITLGNRVENTNYDFRETCFGLCMKNEKLLMIKQPDGEYSLIGGGLEENETFDQCLRREFLEESGYSIKSIRDLCIIDCFWITRNHSHMESLVNVFMVEIDDNGSKKTVNEGEICQIELSEVKNLLPLPYHKKAIDEFIIYLNKKI